MPGSEVHALHVPLILEELLQELANSFDPRLQPDHAILDAPHLVQQKCGHLPSQILNACAYAVRNEMNREKPCGCYWTKSIICTCQICMQAWHKQVETSRNRAIDLTVCTVGLLRTGSPALHSSSVIPDSFAQTCRSRASSGEPNYTQDYAEGREATATEKAAQCSIFDCNARQRDYTVSSTASSALSSKGVSSYDL